MPMRRRAANDWRSVQTGGPDAELGASARPTTIKGINMNVQEKLAAIEQHAAKSLIEIRELMVYLSGHPAAVVSFDDVPEYKPVP